MRISELKILKGVPFSQEDRRWLTFHSLAEQQQFFSSKAIKTFNNLSFVKGFLNKKIKLDFEGNYNELILSNYVMFKNEPYESKWFYAYITNFEYISDYCMNIEIEIDYFQSYMGEIQFHSCEIERQHTFNDDPSYVYNLKDEPYPETQPDGSFDCIGSSNYTISNWKVAIVYKPNLILDNIQANFGITNIISGADTYKYRDLAGGTYTQYNIVDYISDTYYSGGLVWKHALSNQNDASAILQRMFLMEFLGYTIVRCYMTPADNYISTTLSAPQNPYNGNKQIPLSPDANYTPQNNKCYLSPYMFYELTNNQGKTKKYDNRDSILRGTIFSNTFQIAINVMNIVEGICYPLNYKMNSVTATAQDLYGYGVELGDTPECMWNNQASNFAKQALSGIGSMVLGAGKAYAGDPSGAKDISKGAINTFKSFFTEDTAGGVISQGILQSIMQIIGFNVKLMCCIKSIIQIDYNFTLYGYYLGTYFDVNVLSRKRFNYVKTTHANIQGNIPIECKKIITQELNNGITFWHDLNNFDYYTSNGFDNPIVANDLTENLTIF